MKDNEALVTLEPINYSITAESAKEIALKYKIVPAFDASKGKKDPVNAQIIIDSKHLNKEFAQIEKMRKHFKEPALNYGRAVDSLAKELQGIIEPAKLAYKDARGAIDRYEQEQEQLRIEAEQRRVEKIRTEIQILKEIPLTVSGKTAKEIEAVYDHVPIPAIETFQERHEEALEVYRHSMANLEDQIINKRKSEEADAIIEKEKEKARLLKEKNDEDTRLEREAFAKEKAEFKEEKRRRQAEIDAEDEVRAKAKAEREAEELELQQEEERKEKSRKALQTEYDKINSAQEALQRVIDNTENYAQDIVTAIIDGDIPYVSWDV